MNPDEIAKIEVGVLVHIIDKINDINRIAEVVKMTDELYPVKLVYVINKPLKGPAIFGWQPKKAKNVKILGHKRDFPEYYL